MKTAQLLDARGVPVKKAELKTEVSRATVGGVRSPMTGYPADGMNPSRLANILREADGGDAIRWSWPRRSRSGTRITWASLAPGAGL